MADLPFENGERPLVKYPQKRPMLRLTARPPQLETPFAVFNEGITTPNDAFFVRYHLTNAPPAAELLTAEKFRLQIKGSVNTPLSFSVAQLKSQFESMEVVAVNQCSGNSRGFFQPPSGNRSGVKSDAELLGVELISGDSLSGSGCFTRPQRSVRSHTNFDFCAEFQSIARTGCIDVVIEVLRLVGRVAFFTDGGPPIFYLPPNKVRGAEARQ
jgi:hypothetical protein